MFDSPRHILYIGGNHGQELDALLTQNASTLESITYIEAIPEICERLQAKLESYATKTSVKLRAICALVSDMDGDEVPFYLSSNEGQSSSMFQPNPDCWVWDWVSFSGSITLKTVTIDTLIQQGILDGAHDTLALDVQGSELKVLKGLISILPVIQQIQCEFSKKEFYKGGVLLPELHEFLSEAGFEIVAMEQAEHGDMYLRRARD